MFKKITISSMLLIVFLTLLSLPKSVNAQVKDYHYEDFAVDIQINQDSTFDVTETQTYKLNGNFGFFFRDIERKKLDHISNIETLDKNNNPLPSAQIEKSQQASSEHIQWNFPRRDFNNELLTWKIKYKVHGGLDFYKNRDELYWNAIPAAGREKEIKNLTVTIHLPEKFSQKDFQTSIYTESMPGTYKFIDNHTITYQTNNLPAYTNYTIAIDWPAGYINKPLFYREQFFNYITAIISLLILVIGTILIFQHWKKKGKDPRINKTIIAEYEPPENLKPAIVEVLINQNLTKALPATIIDLARQDYFKIKEISYDLWGIDLGKEYEIEKIKEMDDNLLSHEKTAYTLLFPESTDKKYSTKKSPKERSPHKMQKMLLAFNKSVYKETEKTAYFTENVQKIRKKYQAIFIVILILSIITAPIAGGVIASFGSYNVFRIIMLDASLSLIATIGLIFSYYMPKATQAGAKQKYKWLCFKEYLKTAERYRLEKETPETFSLYLPYAIILEAEKEWIKKFEPTFAKEGWNQNWYIPSAVALQSSQLGLTPNETSFSASDFTSSFSAFTSSFTRSFTSSSSSGVSGGGGSSGGGGGGGGGGSG